MTLLIVLLTSYCLAVGDALSNDVTLQVVKSNSVTQVEMKDIWLQSMKRRRDTYDADQQSRIVDLHNALRRLEGSSDMQFMTWNDALASMAETWAERCAFVHGQPSVSNAPYSPIGQNLYAISGATLNVTRAVVDWYNEKTDYNYNSLGCSGPACGHYTQVVWSSSRQVGCAYAFCRSLTSSRLQSAHYLVCNYGPTGNYRGQTPYKIGRVCSDCLNGIGWCTDGLCNSNCKRAGSNCKCGAICYNCAELKSDSCTCQCADGWHGNDCSVPCKDTNKYCNAGWPPHWCNHPQNGDYVRDGCPAMCGLCKQAKGVRPGQCSPVGGLGSSASYPIQRPLTYSFITATLILFTRCRRQT